MRGKTIRTFVVLALVLVLEVGITRAVRTAEDPTIPDELKFILAENEASFQKVAWVSYHLDQTRTDIRHGNQTNQLRKDVIQKWPYRFVNCDRSSKNPSDASLNSEISARTVLNQDYFGSLVKGQDFATCEMHESIDNRTSRSNFDDGALAGNNPLFYGGFGYDNCSLRTHIYGHPLQGTKWEIREQEDNGERVFIVNRLYVQGPAEGGLIDSWTFSPTNGFLLKGFRNYQHGKLYRECTVKIGRFGAENAWFPVSFDQTDYAPSQTPDGKVIWQTSVRLVGALSQIAIQPHVLDGQFTLAALGLHPGEKILALSSRGTANKMTWTGEAMLPDLTQLGHAAELPVGSRVTSTPMVSMPTPPSTLATGATVVAPSYARIWVALAAGGLVFVLVLTACSIGKFMRSRSGRQKSD